MDEPVVYMTGVKECNILTTNRDLNNLKYVI